MSLPPLSRASVSLPSSARTSSNCESRPARAQEPGAALRRMLATDGFDSPLDTKKAGGLAEVEDMLTKLARVLSQSLRTLGVEGAPSAAGPQASSPVSAKAAASPGDAPKTGNTMTFQNDGTKPMTIQFTPNAGEKPVDSVTLAPGEKRTVGFPQGWSGNFRSTQGAGAAATLGEVKFNGGGNQTYYDVSYIEGHNASMTIQPESGGRKSGTLDNLLASAPDAIKARDASGAVYGLKKTTTSNVQDGAVVDYFRKQVGEAQGYVIPTDDASTLGTSDSHLSVHLKNVV